MDAKRTLNRPTPAPEPRAARPTPGPAVLSLRSERATNGTMAASVADAIVSDVVALGWPEGEVLGSEPELLHALADFVS